MWQNYIEPYHKRDSDGLGCLLLSRVESNCNTWTFESFWRNCMAFPIPDFSPLKNIELFTPFKLCNNSLLFRLSIRAYCKAATNYYFHNQLMGWLFSQWIVSIKCLWNIFLKKMWNSSRHNFQVTFSTYLFCQANSPKPKEKLQVLTFNP